MFCRRFSARSFQRAIFINSAVSKSFTVSLSRCLFNSAALSNKSETVVDNQSSKYHFVAETRRLLDILSTSLYSEKDVFIRELLANCSDALERRRLDNLTSAEQSEKPFEIQVTTDDVNGTITIYDTGVGMSYDDLKQNLGTIARSGSRDVVQKLGGDVSDTSKANSIIGQFGVGFYSAFLVASKVQVFSRVHNSEASGWCWSCEANSEEFTLEPADDVDFGTKVVMTLRTDCLQYASEPKLREIISKHASFLAHPVFLNKTPVEIGEAIFLENNISDEQHERLYQQLAGGSIGKPRFTLVYKAEAPLDIKSVFYVPSEKPAWFTTRELGQISLYCRRILIQSESKILPPWMRFIRGVVSSDDLPLSLSRENPQKTDVVAKLGNVVVAKIISYLQKRAEKQPNEFETFVKDYGMFISEGVVTTEDAAQREKIASLLRFDTSRDSNKVGLDDYADRMVAGQRSIYYLAAPSYELAESSPYFEAFKQKHPETEVLFAHNQYDDLVMHQLSSYRGYKILNIENEADTLKKDSKTEDTSFSEIQKFLKDNLPAEVDVHASTRNFSAPAVITSGDMSLARHLLRTSLREQSFSEKLKFVRPVLECNYSHPVFDAINKVRSHNEDLAKLLVKEIFDSAMMSAGLVEDPRLVVSNINSLLETVSKFINEKIE